jgi:hypothetical protein
VGQRRELGPAFTDERRVFIVRREPAVLRRSPECTAEG